MDIERGLIKTEAGYLHYRAAGQGDPVILLHINQQSSATYIELIEQLAPRFRAIAIDYPSHGMSDHVSEQPTLEDYARWIVQLLDQLGIERTHVLGEATGAAVAIELGVSFPERIDKVVLVNCPLYIDKHTADNRHAPLKATLRPSDPSGFPLTRTLDFLLQHDADHAPVHPTQSWMDRINVAQLEAGRDRWQALDALHAYDIASNAARLDKPTLLLVGEHFYYLRLKDEFISRIKKLEFHMIEGGRFCMAWEYAQEIGRRFSAFVEHRKN